MKRRLRERSSSPESQGVFEREAEVPEEGATEPVKEGLSFKLRRTSSKLQRKKREEEHELEIRPRAGPKLPGATARENRRAKANREN